MDDNNIMRVGVVGTGWIAEKAAITLNGLATCRCYAIASRTKEKAEAFKAATKAAGTTPNAVFSAAAEAFMQEHGGWDAWMPAAPEVEDTTGED